MKSITEKELTELKKIENYLIYDDDDMFNPRFKDGTPEEIIKKYKEITKTFMRDSEDEIIFP